MRMKMRKMGPPRDEEQGEGLQLTRSEDLKGRKRQRSKMETSGEVKFGEMDVMSGRTEERPRR